jgi:myosin heavy subunit
MHHPNNPPSHPALLALITEGLIECDMRPRKFLQQLTLSQAYRRGGLTRLDSFATAPVISAADPQLAVIRSSASAKLADAKSREAALVAAESTSLKAYETARDTWRAIQGERAKIRTELDAAEAAMLAAKKKSTDAGGLLIAAQKRQMDTASRISLLDESAAKLQQAANLAGGEDAELKQAIAVAKQRADTARAIQPELDKAVADTKAAAEATAPELAATTVKVQEVVAKLQPVHQSLRTADTAMVASRLHWSEACMALKVNEKSKVRNEQVIAWTDGIDTSLRLAGELSAATQAVVTIESELPAVNELIAAAQTQLTAAQAAEQAAVSEQTKATEVVGRHAAEIAQLRQSLDALAASAKLVSTAEPLAAAQTAINTELEARRNQAGAMQTALDAAKQVVVTATAATAARTQEMAVHQANRKAIDDRIAAARASLATQEAALSASKNSANEKWQTICVDASRQLATASLQALTPEQMCWSTLRVTGVLDAYIRNEAAELEKQTPLAADADAATKAIRHRQAVRGAYDKLRGNADVYVSLYASGPDKTEDDFFASADQALYTANAGNVFAWAGPGNNNVTQQAIALTDNAEIARVIYWTLLARQPSAEEVKLVNEQIVASGDGRNAVIQEMVWGLLASAEFRFVN